MKHYRLTECAHDNGSGKESRFETTQVLDFDALSKFAELEYYNDERGEYFGSAAQPSAVAGCVEWVEWHRAN